MKVKLNIKREISIVAVLVVVIGLVVFTEKMKGDTAVSDVRIRIENIHNNHFMDEDDILDLMDIKHDNVRGASLTKLNFREVEERIKKDAFIKDAEVYSDLKGNLTVSVELRRPVARIVRND